MSFLKENAYIILAGHSDLHKKSASRTGFCAHYEKFKKRDLNPNSVIPSMVGNLLV